VRRSIGVEILERVDYRVRGTAIDGPSRLVMSARGRGGHCITGTVGTLGGRRTVDGRISGSTGVLGRRGHHDIVVGIGDQRFDDRVDPRRAHAVIVGDENAKDASVRTARATRPTGPRSASGASGVTVATKRRNC